jgi:hypothetical protein
MRLIALCTAAALVTTPVLAQTAKPPCLTTAEFTAMSSYALPSIISGDELAERYAAGKPAAWPRARAAFLKVGGNTGNPQTNDLLKSLPDASLQPMVDGLIAGIVGQQLPTDRCPAVNRLVQLLSPLPPENTAELIALAAGLGARSGRASTGNFSLCPA